MGTDRLRFEREAVQGRVSVIVPNLNGWRFLKPCLDSVLAQGFPSHDVEVLVVDNGSTDGSVEKIAAEFPRVSVIRNSNNLGFAPAVNQGMEAASGEWLLLLNNDAVLTPGALRVLLNGLREGDSRLGGVQPLLLRASDPQTIDSIGIALGPRFRASDDSMGKPRAAAPRQPTEIWGTCFACALIKRAVFEECGRLDDDYFAEWEDVDFCLRARWHGWSFRLLPQAAALHHRSPTSQREPSAKRIRLRRNQILTYAKSLPVSAAVSLTLYRLQRDLFLLPHYARTGELDDVGRSWIGSLRLLPRMLRRRRRLRRGARLSSREMKRQIRSFTREA